MARRFRTVALGGTFDRLHVGHEALLSAAFASGRTVLIGLTSDRYLAAHPKSTVVPLRPYARRARALRSYLARRFPGRRWELAAIDDRFGRALGKGIDALAISAETREGGRAVNRERRRRGLSPLPLIEVPMVLGEDLMPVSSTRIRSGTISASGHRTGAIRVGLVAGSAEELLAARRAAESVFPRARFRALARPSRLAPRAASGARARAGLRGAELAIGIARSGPDSWFVAVATPSVLLPPRRVRGSRPGTLAAGIGRVLRPLQRKPI